MLENTFYFGLAQGKFTSKVAQREEKNENISSRAKYEQKPQQTVMWLKAKQILLQNRFSLIVI